MVVDDVVIVLDSVIVVVVVLLVILGVVVLVVKLAVVVLVVKFVKSCIEGDGDGFIKGTVVCSGVIDDTTFSS